MRGAVGHWVRGVIPRAVFVCALIGASGIASGLQAQNQIAVPFTNGFIGTRGSSAGTGNNVLTYATLGIARTFFIQNSSTNQFELQGNDIPGTLRIVRTDGTTIDIPASANWRNSGNNTYLIGVLPRPASPITLVYPGGSIQITDGAQPGGTSVGCYVAAYTGAVLTDGSSTSGNAALSQVIGGLNSYLSTVVAARPAGPVTVDPLTTLNTTPTITGTATLAAGEALSVVVAGVQYTTGSTPAVAVNGTTWSLSLTSPLALGTYPVTATITNSDGFTLSDPTTNELVIGTAPPAITTVTVGGAFTATDKVYDGGTVATGTTSGLTLAGVTSPDQVTIASVTLAFQSATVGSGKTVSIAAVTLGGADAGRYTVSLTGAPTATARITAKPLVISGVSATSKTYDGTTTVTLSGTPSYSGLVTGESFSVAGTPTATFATAGVGTAKAVTVSGYTAPSANYSLTQPTGLTASVTARPLTIGGSFTAADKIADGTTAATITANTLSLTGAIAGDTVALTGVTATFADTVVGSSKPVTLNAATLTGASAGNYTLTLAGAPATTASILAATPPAAPASVTTTAGETSIALAWTPPASIGCAALSAYVAEYSGDGGHTWTRVTLPASSSSTTISGLTNGISYLVRVAATNTCGTGAFATAGPAVPVGPARDGSGRATTATPGSTTTTTGGTPQTVTTTIVQDSIVRVTGSGYTLQLRALDHGGVVIPMDSTRTLDIDQGGRAATNGSGFAPGTLASVYIVSAAGTPVLLGTVPVAADGSFAASLPIADTLAAGDYTLQVNGVTQSLAAASVAIGVSVTPPPPDLALTSTPNQPSPAPGDTITITLTITNQGRGPAIDVVIPRAFQEPGFTVVRTTPVDGTYDTATKSWHIAQIEPGASARMLIDAIVAPPTTPATSSSQSTSVPTVAPQSAPPSPRIP
jgi:hypothetical protein